VFVYGDSLQVYLICIIIPDQVEVEKWAAANDKKIEDYESFINSKEFYGEIESRIKQMCKEKNFNGLEVPKKFFITTREFSVENNTLTPTMKLKRNDAKLMFYKEIKELYDNAKL